jgi:glycine hydroxymethyltransferase
MKSFGIDGKLAEEVLDRVAITTNKQIIPDDPNPPLRPSGIRIGTPAATARGMGTGDMAKLAGWILEALQKRDDAAAIARIKGEVESFCGRFPVPGLA